MLSAGLQLWLSSEAHDPWLKPHSSSERDSALTVSYSQEVGLCYNLATMALRVISLRLRG